MSSGCLKSTLDLCSTVVGTSKRCKQESLTKTGQVDYIEWYKFFNSSLKNSRWTIRGNPIAAPIPFGIKTKLIIHHYGRFRKESWIGSLTTRRVLNHAWQFGDISNILTSPSYFGTSIFYLFLFICSSLLPHSRPLHYGPHSFGHTCVYFI